MKPFQFLAYFISSFLFSTTIFAQNPGGVSANLQYWIKADYTASNMTFSSGRVNEWSNEKLSAYKLTAPTAAQRPIRHDGSSTNSDSLNYQPQVYFFTPVPATNPQVMRNNDTLTYNYLIGTAGTTFTVTNMDSASRNAVTYMGTNNFRYQVKPNFRVQTSDGITVNAPISAKLGYTSDFSSSYNSPRNNARITTSSGFSTTLISRRNSTNYVLTNSNTTPFCPGIATGLEVGGNTVNAEYFHKGRIAEVVFYNTTLTTAEIQRVESYLAVKYGITLNPNGLDAANGYVSSAGATIYSRGLTGTTYWNNIIGLGRDDNSALLQKQSHTYDDSVRLYAGATLQLTNVANTTAITDNSDFLMMGATTGKLMQDAATALEKPNAATIRLDREWKLINTGFNQVFRLQIKLAASVSSYFTGGGILRLLADDDGNFINATEITTGVSGVTITYASGIISISITPASSGGIFPINGTPKYITVAVYNAVLDANITNLLCTKIEKGVLVKWQTSAETMVSHFDVEKSTNLQSWNSIYSEVGKGINGLGASYQFTDATTLETTTYYRVKETNTSGKVVYTELQKIVPQKRKLILNTFPNPATELVHVTWGGFKRPHQIKIVSVDGRSYEVVTTIEDFNATLAVEALPKGMYIIAVRNGIEIIYSKFCKN